MTTILLLCVSNIFMTFAWYGHLKFLHDKPLWITVLISWGIAFFEYVLMVPANRLGYGQFTGYQLKVIQEAITLVVFVVFAWTVLGGKTEVELRDQPFVFGFGGLFCLRRQSDSARRRMNSSVVKLRLAFAALFPDS